MHAQKPFVAASEKSVGNKIRFIYHQFKVVIAKNEPKVTELKPNDKVVLTRVTAAKTYSIYK
jgi:hypothetical protein